MLVTYVFYLTNNRLEAYLEYARREVNRNLLESHPPVIYVASVSQSTINTVGGKKVDNEEKEEKIAKCIQHFHQ